MDLNKRIEDLTKVKAEHEEMLRLTREAARRRTELDAAKKEPVKDEEDRKHIARLEHKLEAAQKRADDQLKRYAELRASVSKEVHADVIQELSSFRENDADLEQRQSEFMERKAEAERNGVAFDEEFNEDYARASRAGRSGIEQQNFERRSAIMKAEGIIEQNKEYLKNIQERIDEAIRTGDESSLAGLQAQQSKLMLENRRQEIQIEKLSTPYRAIEDSEAEYSALYAAKKAMEKTTELGEPENASSAADEITFIDEQLSALQGVATAIDEAIPAQDRYDALKASKNEVTKKKVDAQKLIKSLKTKLANGTIKKEYKDSVRARIEEIESEVKGYEAQEKSYEEKMQALAEKHNLKTQPTQMEQYEAMQAKYQQLQALMDKKQADLKQVTDELAKNPDDKDLQTKKEKLENEINKLTEGKKTCEEKLAEYKELLGIDDKDRDGDGDGAGRDDGDGDGKGGDGKGGDGAGRDDGDGDGKGGDGKGGDGRGEGDEGGTGKDDDGDDRKLAEDYYAGLGIADKHKTKIATYEKLKGHKAGLLTKALLWIPRPDMKKLSIRYLEEGYIQPLYGIKLLGEGEEPAVKSEPEEKGTGEKGEKKEPWSVDKDTEAKVRQQEAENAAKAKMQELMEGLSPEQRENLRKSMEDMMKGGAPKTEKTEKPVKKEEGKGGRE